MAGPEPPGGDILSGIDGRGARRSALRVLGVLGYVVLVAALGLGFLWTLLVLTAAADTSYSVPADAEGWAEKTARVAEVTGHAALVAGCGLVVALALSAVAARRHRGGWLSLGIVAGSLCALTLLAAALSWQSFSAEARAAQSPRPPETAARPTQAAAYVEIQRLIKATLDAVPAQRRADGRPLIVDDVRISSSPCEQERVVLSADLVLAPAGDRTMSADILAVWDDAGYLPDPAAREGTRYSESLPIRTMTLRDTSSRDGLVHLHIVSRCSVVG